MVRYLFKKILETLLTLFIVTTAVFFFVRMIPGDPARAIAGEQATQEDVENSLREETFMDPVFFKEAGGDVDVEAIIKIARGEEAGAGRGLIRLTRASTWRREGYR